MPEGAHDHLSLNAHKFCDPYTTAKGEPRASVALGQLDTLWFNTGSLCNITCAHCYMESSPVKDDLAYLRRQDVVDFLTEIKRDNLPTRSIGFTGGEPFMNPDFLAILDLTLKRDFQVLVLTNAMKPLGQKYQDLLDLKKHHGTEALTFRVSIDHFSQKLHEQERGENTWGAISRCGGDLLH